MPRPSPSTPPHVDYSNTLEKQQKSIGQLQSDVRKVNGFLVAIVVVFFLGFFGIAVAVDGLVVESYRAKENTYQELIISIHRQEERLRASNKKTLTPCPSPC